MASLEADMTHLYTLPSSYAPQYPITSVPYVGHSSPFDHPALSPISRQPFVASTYSPRPPTYAPLPPTLSQYDYQPPQTAPNSSHRDFRASTAYADDRPMSAHEPVPSRRGFSESSPHAPSRTIGGSSSSSNIFMFSMPPLDEPSPLSAPAFIRTSSLDHVPVMGGLVGAPPRQDSLSSPDSPVNFSPEAPVRRRANTRSSSSREPTEDPKDLKRMRNKESSQRFRDRTKERQKEKDERLAWLEMHVLELEAERDERMYATRKGEGDYASQSAAAQELERLQERVQQLEEENARLRRQIRTPPSLYTSTFSSYDSGRSLSS